MVHLTRKFSFVFFILFAPLCQSADSLIDTFITKTGFMVDCQKKTNGDWHHYSCPHDSGLNTLVTVAESDWSYSENINFQTMIDSDGEYSHKNFVVNDWEVFLSKNTENDHSFIAVCNPESCLRIIGEYNNIFKKIIAQLKKNA